MTRSLSPLLRLALAVLLLSPSFGSVQAAAQVANGAAVSDASAHVPLALGAVSPQIPFLSLGLAPALNSFPALTAVPAASPAAAAAAARPAANARFAAAAPSIPASAASAVRGSATAALSGILRPDSKSAEVPAAADGRMELLFDGATNRRDLDIAAPVAAGLPALGAASTLERSISPAAAVSKAAPPAAPRTRRAGRSFAVKALVVVALMLAAPALALAATAAGPAVATAASLSLLTSIHPLASAAGAVAGAIYGMYAARPTDGTAASAGEVFASILRYGVLGGAGVYVLLNLTEIAFAGSSAIGLQPLSSALAIAALGRTAFQDKFTAHSTTGADRIMGAFPAVAAAVGLSVGVALTALAAPALSVVLAAGAMAVTGVATAIYAASYKPGRSPIDGPESMAKGFVLQALMMGLALAVTNSFLFWPFAALGAAGFALVLWTTARQIWSLRPGAPAQPFPPAPPEKPVPPPAPPVPKL